LKKWSFLWLAVWTLGILSHLLGRDALFQKKIERCTFCFDPFQTKGLSLLIPLWLPARWYIEFTHKYTSGVPVMVWIHYNNFFVYFWGQLDTSNHEFALISNLMVKENFNRIKYQQKAFKKAIVFQQSCPFKFLFYFQHHLSKNQTIRSNDWDVRVNLIHLMYLMICNSNNWNLWIWKKLPLL